MHSDAYFPETLLAAGPAAKVYRGVEVATGRKVLMKVLLPDQESTHPLDREKLQLLAPLLLQIRHPHAAGLVTMLPTEDEFALVYDYIPGISGQRLPHERRLPLRDLGALATQLLQAMLAGEHWRAPHGDLKPSNLVVADHPAGGLFLQIQDWALTQTRAQPAPETLWFIAPERHAGSQATTASELFSAAASLFYLATGALPAQAGTSAECLEQWRQFDLRGSMAALRPDLDSAFTDWLAWLLQPDPSQRPAKVRTAFDALAAVMHKGAAAPAAAAESAPTQPMVVLPPTAPPAEKPMPGTSAPRQPSPPQPSPPIHPPPARRGFLRTCLALLLNSAALAGVLWYFGPGVKSWLQSLPSLVVQVRTAEHRPSSSVQAEREARVEEPAPVTPPPPQGRGVTARYVRIALQKQGILNLAEVQVFSGAENIAPTGTASQSTTYSRGPAYRAIDGEFEKGFTQTLSSDTQPWWQLDLGEARHITGIMLWNRTDKYATRLKDFTVTVLDDQERRLWQAMIPEPPTPSMALPVDP